MAATSINNFPKAGVSKKKRVIWSVEGLHKSGKTDLALQAPGPTLLLPWDFNYESTMEKALERGKDIRLPKGGPYRQVFKQGAVSSPDEIINTSKANWERFRQDLRAGAEAGFRTLVVDSASDAWHAYVLSLYGKDTQIKQHHWGALYSSYCNELAVAVNAGSRESNLILIHQLKDDTEEKVDARGEKVVRKVGLKRDGPKKMDYFIGSVIWVKYDTEGGRFVAEFKCCTQNMMLTGQEFELPEEGSFAMLAMEVMPNVDPAMWEDFE